MMLTLHLHLMLIVGKLDLLGLPAVAHHGHMPQLATQPLLSIGQLCNAGCNVACTANTDVISHNSAIILQGQHTLAIKLWELDIHPPPSVCKCFPWQCHCYQTCFLCPCCPIQFGPIHVGRGSLEGPCP